MTLDATLVIGALLLAVVLESALMVWLWRRQRMLEGKLQQCYQRQERQQLDIVGLCAAAVRIDQRLSNLSGRLGEIHEWAQELEHAGEQVDHSYQTAIERIAQGAGSEELVAECGFSREEAELLIRMNRNKGGF